MTTTTRNITRKWLPSQRVASFLIFASLVLAGCGGGGGSSGGAVDTPPPPPPPPPPPAVVSTAITVFAGALGGPGNIDGLPGRLASPASLTIDAAGTIYVADPGNCNIRKLTASGLSLFYGPRRCTYNSSGNLAPADFEFLDDVARGIAADRAGNVFFFSQKEKVLKRIAADGILTSTANRGDIGTFAIDANSTLYYTSGTTLYKVDSNGTSSALASLGRSGFSGLAVGDDGTVFAANSDQHVIYKITRLGVVSTLAGSGSPGNADGAGASAQFNYPVGVAADSGGNVYVTDLQNYTIRKITPAGVVTTLAGTSGVSGTLDGQGLLAKFATPTGIVVDKSGNIFVADTHNAAVRKVSPSVVVTTTGGVMPARGRVDGSGREARFRGPSGLAIDASGNLFAADGDIRKITSAGTVTTFAPPALDINSTDSFPAAGALAIDAQGNLYSHSWYYITKTSNTGNSSLFVKSRVGVFGDVPYIRSVTVDPLGQVYASGQLGIAITPPSAYLGNVYKVSSNGNGSAVACGTNCEATVLTTDKLGNLFAAVDGLIRRVAPDGSVTMLPANLAAFGDQPPFSSPSALAVDALGNIFVADTGNHLIRKISPAGVVTNIAGQAGLAGVTTGALPGLLSYPRGITVDGAGNLFVTVDNAVLKIVP